MMMIFMSLVGMIIIYNLYGGGYFGVVDENNNEVEGSSCSGYMVAGICMGNMIYLISFILLFKYISFDWYFISFNFSLNFYSYLLIIMCLWISGMIIMILTAYMCMNWFLLLMLVLMMFFSTMNILIFYFLFEFSLVIIFLVIMKWGSGYIRYLASYYMMFYTLYFSIPLLIYVYKIILEENIVLMNFMEMLGCKLNMYMFVYMIMAFLVKIPMYMFHGWLLKAHVEAPVYGSMMLASLLLKMGTYGLLRMMKILSLNMMEVNSMILMLSLIGSVYISVICMFQLDMKLLVAYSSVVHMGMLLSALVTMLKLGIIGSYMMMVAHGLCSSGLFYLVNMIYLESGSRLMFINKGMINYNSISSLFWFMFCSSNMAAPISLNLVSEILMLIILIQWFKMLIIILVFYSFFSFSYSLYLFCYVQHGKMNFYIKCKPKENFDYVVLLFHWIPLNLIFLNLLFFI